ncbi:TonB-dependent receptor plug domain-containing protein [Nitrospira sp. M1]
MNKHTHRPFILLFGHILLLIWLFYSAAISYASDEAEITQLDPVIVSASALPTPITRTPASVTVISRSDIAHQQAHRFSEILQQVPGLHVDEMGGRGGINSIYIRGGDPNFTLIMLDGVPINDPTNQRGGSVDLSTLTPERIEKVEIIRGPLSALYGSESVSGAINIITQSGGQESHQLIRGAAGRFGFTRELLQANGPVGPLTYAVSLSHTRNDEQVKHDRFELGTAGWHVNWDNGLPVKLRLTGQFTHTSTQGFPEGSGGSRLAVIRDPETRTTAELVSGLQLIHNPTDHWKHTMSLTIFRRTQDSDNPGVASDPTIFRIPPNTFHTTYTRIQPTWRHTVALTPDWSFAGGIQLTTEIGKRTGIQELTALGAPTDQRTDFHNTRSTHALFTEVSGTLLSDLQATMGLRVDIPEGFGAEVSPRIALSYQATASTRVRTGYGEGFKLPSMASLGDPTIGNPQLKPERSQGWDVSIHHSLGDDGPEIELTYFHNRFSQLIDLDPALARMNMFRLVNLQTVNTQGLELSTLVTPLDGFSVKGFVTYLDTEIEGTSDPLRNRPKWSGGLTLTTHPSATWTIRTQVRVIGTRFDLQIPTEEDRVGGYVKADLAITYRPTPAWRLFGIFENFTNTSYEEYLGFRAPGLFFRMGIEYSL